MFNFFFKVLSYKTFIFYLLSFFLYLFYNIHPSLTLRSIEMIYDKTKIPKSYKDGRKLPEETMQLWLEAIGRRIPKNKVNFILDVGCGTGRFSVPLSNYFESELIGIDPSKDMLAIAKLNQKADRVKFDEENVHEIPVENEKVDLIFMSMVYHYIMDIDLAIREFDRVLKTGGYLCIRNSTSELLNKIPYLKYFPAALEFNRYRLPYKEELIGKITGKKFDLVSHDVIEQKFANSFEEYYNKIKHRALSDLTHISDIDFQSGLQKMEISINKKEITGEINESIDLFIFQKIY